MNSAAFAAGSTGLGLISVSSGSIRSAVQDLGHVEVLEIDFGPARDALLMHQTGHVRRNHVFGSMAELVLNLVEAHSGRDGFVRNAKRTAKATALIGSVQGHHY